MEDIAVKVSQSKNTDNAYALAIKLLQYRPESHQAYYMRSAYFESKKDNRQARLEMLMALDIDPYNSVYLLGMAVLDYNLGNVDSARKYLAETIRVNPNQQGIDIVNKLPGINQ